MTTCAKCGAPIHGRRADALYCGANCCKAVWREANREQIRERGRVAGLKERLLRPEAARARDKKWAQSNPASVLRRNQKIREGLTDAYVADRLGLSVRAVPTEMLAAKRMQLLINRKLKESK